MFRKHKIASRVPLFFRKPNLSPVRFSSIFFSIHLKMIFVKILDVCVRILKVRYSSHFVDFPFFGNITIILFLKSSGIFPVVYMLLIRQYKVCLVSSSSACSNSAGMLSTPYAFFISVHLMLFKILTLSLLDPVLRGQSHLLLVLLNDCITLQYIVAIYLLFLRHL